MVNPDTTGNQIIFLLGFMGVGKSTLGKLLAHNLKLPFIDLDEFLEQEEEMTIEEIFLSKGESYFRGCEAFYLRLIIAKYVHGAVVATGGGAPCHSSNLDLMNRTGLTVYLKASSDSLAERLSGSHTVRPLIQGKTKAQVQSFVMDLLASRESYYTGAIACFQVDPDQDKSINAAFLEQVVRKEMKHSI